MTKLSAHPKDLEIKDFLYDLPDERIARFPLKERDLSKLLVYKQGAIQEDVYRNLDSHIPADSLLLLNRAKVIHARLFFHKATGGKLEIFCLEPDTRYSDITTAMMQEGSVYWKCLIKGAQKWKDESKLELNGSFVDENGKQIEVQATAEKIAREGNSFILKFSWESNTSQNMSFSEFLEHIGKIPIPPYLRRKAEDSDETNYQTIFAKDEGSVAAPTAALHFTPLLLKKLQENNTDLAELTLHVGAGTFMPVKSDKMQDHQMHSEWIEISRSLAERVYRQLSEKKNIIAVGTTSARTIESLYWMGVQLLNDDWDEENTLAVSQWYPYEAENPYETLQVVEAILDYMAKKNLDKLVTRTKLIIAPGYDFKIPNALITNFHQPSSTLLLMIAALVGDDWHKIYDYALTHDFRFLSYGDGSLLWKKD